MHLQLYINAKISKNLHLDLVMRFFVASLLFFKWYDRLFEFSMPEQCMLNIEISYTWCRFHAHP